jgi:uncharacterized protein
LNIRRFFSQLRIIQSVHKAERPKVRSLLHLYEKLNNDISRFQRSSGLHCQAGCGKCCNNPKVETTVLEMIPLAVELWREGQGEHWLNESAKVEFKGPCVFYKADPLVEGNGRCSVYHLRPLICRLFGFSAITDKNNQKKLLTCPIIKSQCADLETLEKKINEDMFVPKTTDYTMQVMHMDPQLGQKQLPINEALKLALEKVGLSLKYGGTR